MNLLTKTGRIAASDFGPYDHYSIISDRIGSDGHPMLISLTKRNGMVKEENWTIATHGRPTKLLNLRGPLSPIEAHQRARSQIGKLDYRLFSSNCEHFARWAHGLPAESKQIVSGVVGAGLGYTLAKSSGAKPVMCCLAAAALSMLVIEMTKES